jgi:hypothetical protein
MNSKLIPSVIIFSLIHITCIAQHSSTSVWTYKYKKMLYDNMYKQADSLYKYDSDKKAYADCTLQKFMIALPNGFNNDPKINFMEVGRLIGKSCALEVKGVPKSKYLWKWTTDTEISFKKALMTSDLKNVSEPLRSKICNCIIQKMKEIDQNGVSNPFPSNEVAKLAEDCVSEL